ncbi:MAG: hypothetical protein IKM44_04810 [Clostridia bacterium]|nr:hypothetical protein [Clostridia bacterium]
MKRNKILKFIALIVSAISIMAVFSGCIFNYEEDLDLNQVILEINPIEIEHRVPVMSDYLDPDGKPVRAEDRVLGEKNNLTLKNGVVQAVKRDHNGNAIYVPKIDGGNILYEKHTAGEVSVDEVTFSAATKESTSDRYAIVYTVNGDTVTADEYYFEGKGKVGDKDVALWVNTDNTKKRVYGKIKVDNKASAPLSGITNALETLPEVNYNSATATISWQRATPVYKRETFKAEKSDKYFKATFLNEFANVAQSMIQDEGKDVNEVFEYVAKKLYTSTFSRWEVDAAVLSGDVEWGVTEENDLKRTIYYGIESVLSSIYAEISEDFDETYPSLGNPSAPETTYPIPPTEEEKEEVYTKEYEVWDITNEPARCVGNTNNKKLASMQREGVRRFIDYVENAISDSHSISINDRADYEAEIKEMRDKCKTTEGIDELYVNLDDYDVIHYMYGDNYEYSLKTDAHKQYIGKLQNVTTDVAEVYASELAEQKRSFDENIENYYTAASGDKTVLYFADSEYFWVKHLLIPFSTEQTTALTEYKKTHTDAQVEAYRAQLGAQVEVYKHVNGEDDKSKTYSIDEAWADIYGKMRGKVGYTAERAFTDLIYTYNSDPGIFDSKMGYAVTATPAAKGGKAETYMIEFAKESRALLNAYNRNESLLSYKQSDSEYSVSKYDAYLTDEVEIGSISAPALTDYGWHIMYLSYVPVPGTTRSLNEYLTEGRYETVRSSLESDITSRINNAYTSWKEGRANKYADLEGVLIKHKDRLEAKMKEYADTYYNPEVEEEEEEEETEEETA